MTAQQQPTSVYCTQCGKSFPYNPEYGPGGHRCERSYDDACESAAEYQGITPIVDALRRADIPATADQTGGFCMVAAVVAADGLYLYTTPEYPHWHEYHAGRFDGTLEDGTHVYSPVCPDFPAESASEGYCEGHGLPEPWSDADILWKPEARDGAGDWIFPPDALRVLVEQAVAWLAQHGGPDPEVLRSVLQERLRGQSPAREGKKSTAAGGAHTEEQKS